MPACGSMYFVCFSLKRSALLSTWQTVLSNRVLVLVSLSFTITSGLSAPFSGVFSSITIMIMTMIMIMMTMMMIMMMMTMMIIYLLYHSLCWCLFVHQPGPLHAPGASDTQVIHSDHTLSTFLRIRADRSMLIFRVSVTVALSDTLLMFSTIPSFIVPSAQQPQGSLQFLSTTFCVFLTLGLFTRFFFSISFGVIFLSDGINILISLQVEFTESLMMISGLFAVIVLSVLTGMPHTMVILLSLLCVRDSGLCSYHFSITSIS